MRELHASNRELQWMVDAYSLAFAGLLLTMGSPGDRYGRRPALQIGFLVFGAGSAISAIVGGPLTGGFRLEHFHWGSIFLVNLRSSRSGSSPASS